MAEENENVRVKEFVETVDITDLTNDDYLLVDRPNETVKIHGDAVAPKRGSTTEIRNLPDKSEGYLALNDANSTGKFLADNLIGSIAPIFSDTTDYKNDDRVMYEGKLYRCIVDHPAGTWNSSHFIRDTSTNDINLTDAEVMHVSDDQFVKIIHSFDIERGTIDGSGNAIYHIYICRTKAFIPVKKGDRLIRASVYPNTNVATKIVFYDTGKAYVGIDDWYVENNRGKGKDVECTADGYIKVCFHNGTTPVTTRSQIDYFDGAFAVCRFAKSNYFGPPFYETICDTTGKISQVVFSESFIEQGYYDYNNGIIKESHASRCRIACPIKVSFGDIICTKDTAINVTAVILDGNGSLATPIIGNRGAIFCSADGYAYIIIIRVDGASFTPNSVAGKIYVRRFSENEEVFTTSQYDIRKGNWDNNNNITTNSNRIVNYVPIYANKGDIVICNNASLKLNIREVNASTQATISDFGNYFTTIARQNPDVPCTYYEVKNDNVFLNCILAPLSGSIGDLSNYYDCIRIVRSSSRNYIYEKRIEKRYPKSSRKGRVISSDSGLVNMQDGAFVGNELWISYDSGSEQSIRVISPSDGSAIKTITHDFGHNGIADYCEETDTLLNVIPGDDVIYLKPNASSITTSLSKDDCIQIDINTLFGISGYHVTGCFGENKQTIYICRGLGGEIQPYTTENKVYKLWLEYENGAYTGNATLLATYDYRDHRVAGFDADYSTSVSNLNSTQSCKYDGYLYLAYGTCGHNFFICELDDKVNEWYIVGRLAYDYYISNHTKKYLEPEFVALKGDKIVCGSRSTSDTIASIVEFQRGF